MAAPRSRKPGRKTDSTAVGRRAAPGKEGREFVAEAEEILEQMCADLCLLHEQRHAGEIEPDLVHCLFRSAHTLKGLAGLFGLDALRHLAHRLEDVLDALRLGRIDGRATVVALLDEGVSTMLALVSGFDGDDPTRDAVVARAEAFLAELERALAAPVAAAPAGLSALDLDPAIVRALTEYEEHRLRENLGRGRPIVLVDATFDLTAFEEGLAEISAAVRESGEIISTLPSAAAGGDRKICFSLLVATDLQPGQLERRLDRASGSLRVVHPGRLEPARAPADPELGSVETSASAGVGRGSAAEDRRIESLRSISGSVRVDIAKLDLLMNLVGEMASQRSALAAIAMRLAADPHSARIGAELAKVHKLLDRRLKALQAGVLDVRMVPLRQVFEKLSRVVRRLRIDLEKEVGIEFTGGDTELDKLIVEQLVDPLVHIVRNAFDHALEPPSEREAAGKPAIGTIRVAAFQRGNHVVIEVEDDGRGMDVESIRRKAVERGIVSADEALSERDVLNLVFEAGLSTRDEVSQTSGRGVGMDVVRSNLAALGGLVEVHSRKGQGTTITITLPITLAIIQALIVRVGAERYAIPLASVRETLRLADHRVLHTEERELIDLRGTPLLLRRLGDEFEIADAGGGERGFVVVLGMGEQKLGLVVDALDGQQDVVIKPIQGPVQQIRGIAGATELGDRVATLVIDVSALVSESARRREAA
ncbi:MAG: chemotaxis protein CheA [Myxococcota bacterium]